MSAKIIAGFSGIGKTYLGNKYSNVIDLDAAPFVYDDSDILDIPFELRKGMKRKPNKNWPNNYIKAIKDMEEKYDLILVWDRLDIIEEYLKNDIEFILCYPEKNALNNYIERYKERGNSESYITWKLNEYQEKLSTFEKLNVYKIILKDNETLEDYLVNINFNLKVNHD